MYRSEETAHRADEALEKTVLYARPSERRLERRPRNRNIPGSVHLKGRVHEHEESCGHHGSDSDLPVLKGAFDTLRQLEIPFEAHVYSAHRTPAEAAAFASSAAENGFGVLIAAAGKAAHLAGALAAQTVLPVIGIPVKSSTLDGLDALLSTVQMPSGMPVATVAIDGAANAALLAAQILAVEDAELTAKLRALRQKQHDAVVEKDRKLVID